MSRQQTSTPEAGSLRTDDERSAVERPTERSAAPGTVVVSIDAELGWGHHDLASPPVRRVEAGRSGWTALLKLLSTVGVPATWAVVGHLFLTGCDGVHADHPTPPDWFAPERGAWADRPDLRFGPDLVERVAAAEEDHEIAAHTFSHVPLGRPGTTIEIARAEVCETLRAVEDSPIDAELTSLVFPRNAVGHRDVLAEWGFTCYRGTSPSPNGRLSRPLDKVARTAGLRPTVVSPTIDEFGLVNVPSSQYLFEVEGLPRRVAEAVWDDPVVLSATAGVDAAAETGKLFHLWLHPNNLVTDADTERVRRVLAYVARCRDEGAIRVETMGEVADRVLAAPSHVGDPVPRIER